MTWRYGTALGCFAVGWGLHFLRIDRGAWIGWAIAVFAFTSMMFSPISADGRPLLEFGYVVAFALVVLLLADAKMPEWTSGLAFSLTASIFGIGRCFALSERFPCQSRSRPSSLRLFWSEFAC